MPFKTSELLKHGEAFQRLLAHNATRLTFSQLGEDILIAHSYNLRYGFHKPGFYVDIGAYHPSLISNTKFLNMLGWRGINIDPNPEAIEAFRQERPNDINLQLGIGVANGTLPYYKFADRGVSTFCPETAKKYQEENKWPLLGVEAVPVRTINSVLEEHLPAGQQIDFMDVDVEGLDREVIETFDFDRYRPKVILLELDDADKLSLKEDRTIRFMQDRGYTLYAICSITYIFFDELHKQGTPAEESCVMPSAEVNNRLPSAEASNQTVSETALTASFADEYINATPGCGESFVVEDLATDNPDGFHLYALNNMMLFGNGITIGRNGVVVKDSIIRDQHIHQLFAQLFPAKKRLDFRYNRLAGEYVSLLGPWSSGFWHWMMEYLTKLVIAEMHGFRGKYIIAPSSAPFIQESLRLIGIPDERVVVFDANDAVQVERLYVPQRFTSESGRVYLSILEKLRERLLRHVPATSGPFERVYISRQFAGNGRKVVNEKELIALLSEFGFQAVLMERKTLAEQISLMANANFLVGANGSGIFHALLMQKSACILELFAPNYTNIGMIGAVELLHHDYYMISPVHIGDYAYGSDIHAPLQLIRTTIGNHLFNNDTIRNKVPGGRT